MLIRNVQWKDFMQIQEIYNSTYEENRDTETLGIVFLKNKPDIKSEIKWFTDTYIRVLKKEGILMVAEDNNKIAGYCGILSARPDSESAHVGILGILIKKEYRGKGFGTALLRSSIENSKGIFEKIYMFLREIILQ